MGSGEWGVGSGEFGVGTSIFSPLPISPLPTPHSYHSGFGRLGILKSEAKVSEVGPPFEGLTVPLSRRIPSGSPWRLFRTTIVEDDQSWSTTLITTGSLSFQTIGCGNVYRQTGLC